MPSLQLISGDSGADGKSLTLEGEDIGEAEDRSTTFLHILLSCKTMPCWVSACLRRSTFLWKARPHRVQANGLKPECLRLCVIRLDDCEKAFPHSLHT